MPGDSETRSSRLTEGDGLLTKAEERVKFLKRGFTGKDIEKAYLMANDIRLINRNILFIPEWKDS